MFFFSFIPFHCMIKLSINNTFLTFHKFIYIYKRDNHLLLRIGITQRFVYLTSPFCLYIDESIFLVVFSNNIAYGSYGMILIQNFFLHSMISLNSFFPHHHHFLNRNNIRPLVVHLQHLCHIF